MSPVSGASAAAPTQDGRHVLRALAAPPSDRSDELLACCLRVAQQLGLPEAERVALGRAAQLHHLGGDVMTAGDLVPELRKAAAVVHRALDRWDATREVPLTAQVLAACDAMVSGAGVDELRGRRFASEVVDALATVTA